MGGNTGATIGAALGGAGGAAVASDRRNRTESAIGGAIGGGTGYTVGKSMGGTNYEIPDELLGFMGFRKIPLDLERNFNFKIADFQESKRNEAKKIFEDLRTGDPVEDPNKIIRQY